MARLARYLRVLDEGVPDGTVSSAELARLAGVDAATLRRDLSFVGSYGVRGVGYDAGVLRDEIARTLGADRLHPVALVGVGNLGHALAAYPGFADRGMAIRALFEADRARVGGMVAGVRIDDAADIAAVCRARRIRIGLITTPAAAAQQVADSLVAGQVRSILNFAPCGLQVPETVLVRRVDLAVELQILAFYETQRSAVELEADGAASEPADGQAAG